MLCKGRRTPAKVGPNSEAQRNGFPGSEGGRMSDMGIAGVGSSAAKAVSAGKDKGLSQADFLSLLTQQMRNQDPTKPMDSSQMLSLLAQISQVSATQALQTSFDALSRSEEHTSELQSLMRISYAVFCLKKKHINNQKPLCQNHTQK